MLVVEILLALTALVPLFYNAIITLRSLSGKRVLVFFITQISDHQIAQTIWGCSGDYGVPALKIAVEYEGGIFEPNGDHRSMKGVQRDIEKYNAA